jgi:hypothetical protein
MGDVLDSDPHDAPSAVARHRHRQSDDARQLRRTREYVEYCSLSLLVLGRGVEGFTPLHPCLHAALVVRDGYYDGGLMGV